MTSKKAGQMPGTLTHVGHKRQNPISISLIDYSKSSIEEKKVAKLEECYPYKHKSTVTWINVSGLHHPKIIGELGKHYGIHSLILEDILNTEQRPKMEDFDTYLYFVLKLITYDDKKHKIMHDQVSIILGKNFIITFHENHEDVFENIRHRLRNAKGSIRSRGAGYLAYSLLDAIVDHYFIVLEQLGNSIEKVEDELVRNPSEKTLRSLNVLKREIMYLRRFIWPVRDTINGLIRAEHGFMKEASGVYLRDVSDHTTQVIETIDTYRETLSSMFDMYMSSVSNRMNEVMKVLTVIATIFIPLTFITGVYGMNFRIMPEIEWHYGYAFAWGIMILVGLGMAFYFHRKKWL